jgi:hypothetical protein
MEAIVWGFDGDVILEAHAAPPSHLFGNSHSAWLQPGADSKLLSVGFANRCRRVSMLVMSSDSTTGSPVIVPLPQDRTQTLKLLVDNNGQADCDHLHVKLEKH